MLLASGPESTRGVYGSAGYFESLATPEGLDFGWRYTRRFGPEAPPLNSLGESCYEGILMLSALARRSGTLDTRAMGAVSDSVRSLPDIVGVLRPWGWGCQPKIEEMSTVRRRSFFWKNA